MSFLSRIKNPDNNVVRGDEKHIIQCMEEKIGDFYVSDNLRGVNYKDNYNKLEKKMNN